MKRYFTVFGMRAKMEMQYRGAMLGGILCQVFFGLVLIALYRALYTSKPQNMPFEQVATYVWLQQAFFRMLLSSDADLTDKIRTGAIAYDLCRPVDLYGFYYARIVAQKLVGSLMRALPMLLFACLLPEDWRLSPPSSSAAFACAFMGLLLGLACVSALENLAVAFSMRTVDAKGIQSLMSLMMMLLSGNVLPLTLFPDSWQKVMTLLPYAQLLDAPIRLYTGFYPVSRAGGILAVQAVWTGLIMLLGSRLWHINSKRLLIQGG